MSATEYTQKIMIKGLRGTVSRYRNLVTAIEICIDSDLAADAKCEGIKELIRSFYPPQEEEPDGD